PTVGLSRSALPPGRGLRFTGLLFLPRRRRQEPCHHPEFWSFGRERRPCQRVSRAALPLSLTSCRPDRDGPNRFSCLVGMLNRKLSLHLFARSRFGSFCAGFTRSNPSFIPSFIRSLSFHSRLNASIGSTRLARRAGTPQASRATETSSRGTAAKVS